MARQLIEYRTPAAYAGVENYATKHTGAEPGALAWFAIGYAHYLDGQYPASIAALEKAQPYIGELKDYTAYFIGSSYVASNNPAGVIELSDATSEPVIRTRFIPTTPCWHTQKHCLPATVRRRRCSCSHIAAGAVPRSITCSARPMCRMGRDALGAEVLRRVYYNYPTSSQADLADSDLKKIPEAQSLPAVTFAEHQRRADGLYKGRRWAPAAEEYKAMLALSPADRAVAGQYPSGECADEAG